MYVFNHLQEEQKCKHMVAKITNILRETLTQGSGGISKGQSLRSSYPLEGKSEHEMFDPVKGTGDISPHRHSAEVHMQTGYRTQGETIRPELGLADSSFAARSSVGQSGKSESCSVAKRARTELLDQLNLE